MVYKVVIIDDVALVRQALKQTIDWESIDCTVVGEAADGLTGRDVIIETKPDIVITDIRMPGLNGLELIEAIQASLPNSKMIIITGHQEFEYARKALELGVTEFVLKPIRNERIVKAVKTAISAIAAEKEALLRRQELLMQKHAIEQEYNESLELLRDKQIANILNGFIELGDAESIRTTTFRLGAEAKKIGYLIIENHSYDKKLLQKTIHLSQQLLHKIKQEHPVDTVLHTELFSVHVLVLIQDDYGQREAQVVLRAISDRLLDHLCEQLQAPVNIGYSMIHDSVAELIEAHDEAAQMYNMIFFDIDDTNTLIGSVDSDQNDKTLILQKMEEYYAKLSDVEHVNEELLKMFKAISCYSKGNAVVARGLLTEVWITTLRYYYSTSNFGIELEKTLDSMLEELSRIDSLGKIYEYMNEYIAQIVDRAKADRKNSPLVESILKDISEHFSEPISLESIADRFSMNASYLSRLLKKETGRNFVRILTETRIEESKKLLKDPKNRVSDVAEMVGYIDYDYFYRVFKKAEGISPTEYVKGQKA